MDDRKTFKKGLEDNVGKKTELTYRLPEMNENHLRYFEDNFNAVCDQIHSLIKIHAEEPTT
jgi:hypothetical protein